MRFVPLVPSENAPEPWIGFRAVELHWTGQLHAGWARQIRHGQEIHALHFDGICMDSVLNALRTGLQPDFLILSTPAPAGRMEVTTFLTTLEILLEATVAQRIVIKPGKGSASNLAHLLTEAHGEAVGFCWDGGNVEDLEAISDRLFCVVATPEQDLGPLIQLGYRWNVAIGVADPLAWRRVWESMALLYPQTLFPLGRPKMIMDSFLPLDPDVVLGNAWGEEGA